MNITLNIYGFYLILLLLLMIAVISIPNLRDALTKIHSDREGNLSWMRVGSTMVLVFCIVLSLTEKMRGESISSDLIMVLVGTIFAGKATQTGINSNR